MLASRSDFALVNAVLCCRSLTAKGCNCRDASWCALHLSFVEEFLATRDPLPELGDLLLTLGRFHFPLIYSLR